MRSRAPNRNSFWANLIIEELIRNGTTVFYASPGSRSAPLVCAAWDHPMATVHMHYDERGSAFMALGYGKATNKAAGWITTSGTAVANGFPAIVEASQESVPMVLLTADRPPELRDTDANQTILQDHIFGRYVRWFVDLPVPSDDIDPAYVLTTVDQAIQRSSAGPVHLNCPFTEPLAPSEESYAPILSPRFKQWQKSDEPYTSYSSDGAAPPTVFEKLESAMKRAERPMVLLGRMRGDPGLIERSASLWCKAFGAVYVSDISSQARLGKASGNRIAHIDALLYRALPESLHPDLIIQFGAGSLSKRLGAFIESCQSAAFIVIDGRERRLDPHHGVSYRIETDPVILLSQLGGRQSSVTPASSAWIDDWSGMSLICKTWIDTEVLASELTEQAVSAVVSRHLENGDVLIIGSSNSVRHMDMCASTDGSRVPVLTNRGASGIDGTIASAIGFADGHKARPLVLLGDLALLHDLNSLALCKERNAIVVVTNNDGGGIFSYLPIREHTEVFEPMFGTPHGLGFESAAKMFHLSYAQPATIAELQSALSDARSHEGRAAVIEVVTNRQENLREVCRLLKVLSDKLDEREGKPE